MSYIVETAKMLGVELNEYFDVYDAAGKEIGSYCFDEIGFPDSKVLLNILNGTYTMKKKLFWPKNGEIYYFLAPDSNFNFAVNKKSWADSTIDYIYYYAGNVFRNVEEATNQKDELMHTLTEHYNENAPQQKSFEKFKKSVSPP